MKICITGHTKGIGKFLYNKLSEKNHTVLGFSRSNGFDLDYHIHRVIEKSVDCDLFINNAPAGDAQIILLEELCTSVPKIITMGSVCSNYRDIFNKKVKNQVEDICDRISLNPNLSKILLMKLGFLEGTQKAEIIGEEVTISFKEIYEFIEFWLSAEPKIYKVDYTAKLTKATIDRLEHFDVENGKYFNQLLKDTFKYNS